MSVRHALCSVLLALPLHAETLLVAEDFSSGLGNLQDLTRAVTWGTNTGAVSGFVVANGEVTLSDAILGQSPYGSSGHKAFTALDLQFATPVLHADQVVLADFRLRWAQLDNSSSGEAGRFMLILNHAYPAGGLDLDLDDKVDDFDQPWWARPAYHVRIRAGDNPQSSTLLQYGGGLSDLGEYEASIADGHWFGGFISGAGGLVPGSGDDFPANSWVRTASGLAATQYQRFRYIVRPGQQEIWRDANDNGLFETGEREAVMPLPASSTAPLYRAFTQFEGLRLYWRGGGVSKGKVWLDDVRVSAIDAQLALNGTVQNSGVLDGPVVVRVSTGSETQTLQMVAPGPFAFATLPGAEDLKLEAFLDVNDDGEQQVWEPRAETAEPLFLRSATSGVELVLIEPDEDQDNLPDAWEWYYYDSTNSVDAASDSDVDGLNSAGELQARTHPRVADTDEDGMKDGDEVLAGSDPRSALSLWRQLTPQPAGSDTWVLSWPSLSGRQYHIDISTNLPAGPAGFVPLLSAIPADAPLNSQTVTVHQTPALFRIRVEAQP